MKKWKIINPSIVVASSMLLTNLVGCNNEQSSQITVRSFVERNVGIEATYHFTFNGKIPDDNELNVIIYKPGSTITPDNLQLLQSRIDLSEGREFDVRIELTNEFYTTNIFEFDLYFTGLLDGKQTLYSFDQPFVFDYRVSIGHNISNISDLIQPENNVGDVLNFNFSILDDDKPERIYARIVHDDLTDPKIIFDGADTPTSDYIIELDNDTNTFVLPIKRIENKQIYSLVNFGIEFRYTGSDGKLWVAERINNFGILPELTLVNINFDSKQKERTVDGDNFVDLKFNWRNDVLPSDKKVVVKIEGDDNICFDNGQTTKEIAISNKSDKTVSIGFKSFNNKNALINLNFVYSLAGESFHEGVLVTLCPFNNFIVMEKTTYSADSNDFANLEYDWISNTIPDGKRIHAVLDTDEVSFVDSQEQLVHEIDIPIFFAPSPKIKSKISFTNRQFYCASSNFNVIFSYKINGSEVKQKFNVVLKSSIEQWFYLSPFTQFSEEDHTEQSTIEWLWNKTLKDNKVEATIVNGNADFVCFDNGSTTKTFDINDQTKQATVVFKNEYFFENKIETKIKLDFSVFTIDGQQKEITEYIDYDFNPLQKYHEIEPNIYFDKSANYGWADIYLHWTNQIQPFDNLITFELPNDSIFTFSQQGELQSTITIPFVPGRELYSVRIYLKSGAIFNEGSSGLTITFMQDNNKRISRKMAISLVDFEVRGLTVLDNEVGNWHLNPEQDPPGTDVGWSEYQTPIWNIITWPTSILPDNGTVLNFWADWQEIKDPSWDKNPEVWYDSDKFVPQKKGDEWKVIIIPGYYRVKMQMIEKIHPFHISYTIHSKTFQIDRQWSIIYNGNYNGNH